MFPQGPLLSIILTIKFFLSMSTTVRRYQKVAIFAGVMALMAFVGCAVLTIMLFWTGATLPNLTTNKLTVVADPGEQEGILVKPQPAATSPYGNTFAGISIQMPNTTSDTQQTGVTVMNGQYGFNTSGAQGSGIRINSTNVSSAAVQVEGGTTGKIVKNGSTVIH